MGRRMIVDLKTEYVVELLLHTGKWEQAFTSENVEQADEFWQKAKKRKPPGKIRMLLRTELVFDEYDPAEGD